MAEASIHGFFEDSEIFITGGSGFVGRVLVEKLLRTCKGVKRICLLMRPKKGVDPWHRIDTMTDCRLFEGLKNSDPLALTKIDIVVGDAMQLGLGLSEPDLEKVKRCSVIFHCAASVRFDDPIKDAILLNTRGTREVCKIAEDMKDLRAMVHVSTTFIQPKLFGCDEIFYPADCDWAKMVRFAEVFDDDLMNCLEKK
jgi:fatty acyl-CoA reductase